MGPCRKCGSTMRYRSGACKPCHNARKVKEIRGYTPAPRYKKPKPYKAPADDPAVRLFREELAKRRSA